MIRYIQDKIEWRRMKRVAFDHPYFDVKAHHISEHEADRIMRKHQVRNVKEVLRLARIECGIPEPIRNKDSHAPSVERQRNKRFAAAFPFRRAIITLVVVLAVACFLALTKPGIALAQEIYEVIVRVFNGTLLVRNKMPDEISSIDFSMLPTEYSSLEDVAQTTGRAMIVPSKNDGELSELFVDIMGNEMMMVSTKYISEDGKSFRVAQTLHNDNSLWSGAVSTTDDVLEPLELQLGMTVYFGQMADGTIFAEAHGAGYDLDVFSTDLSIEELREIIERIQIVR